MTATVPVSSWLHRGLCAYAVLTPSKNDNV